MTHKERLNIIKTESGRFSGHTVNFPLVCQGDSVDHLKKRMKSMLKAYIRHIEKLIDQDEPFNVVMFDDLNDYLNQHNK